MESTLKKSVASIYESINDADKYFYESIYSHDEEGYSIGASEYYLKHAFVELLMILDHKGFEKTHSEVSELFVKAKNGKGGITKMEMGPHDPYLAWSGVIRPYVASLANIYNIEADEASIPTALIEVIRHSAYSINDKSIFVESPKNEREMHNRIEGIIRCIYPDMIHEPSLAKQIKNFKPDTGIPSIKTLIEYKFITNKTEAKRVADEILADTRGYKSKEWNKILFVVYETSRIKHEKEWKQLIRECGAYPSTEIIVLSGEPAKKKKTPNKANSAAAKKPRRTGVRS